MNIGIYIENYRAGGLDRVVVETLNNWPDPTDQFALFCNANHAGLPHLKEGIVRTVRWVIYPCPLFMRFYDRSGIWVRLLDWGRRSFYNVLGCYLAFLWEMPRLIRLFKGEKLDILFVHNGGWPAARSTRSAVIASKWTGVKKIFLVIHGLARKLSPLIRFQERFLERIIARWVAGVIAVSEAVGKSLERFTRLPPPTVIHNGIQLPPLKDALSHGATADLRAELQLTSETFLIGMFGTFEGYRGHAFIVEVMKNLIQQVPNTVLLIGGTGTPAERKAIGDLLGSSRLDGRIRLLGFRSDLQRVIAGLDAVVNPVQAHESFGLVSLEAMAAKKPVVATRVGGIPEVVKEGETGFLISPDDPELFAQRLATLARDPELRRRMGEAGFARFRDRFQARRMAEDYHRLVS